MRPRSMLLAIALAACDGGNVSPDAGPFDPPDAGPIDPPADARDDRWAGLDALLIDRAEGMSLGLAIYDADDRLVYERMIGDFAPDREVAIASASKIVAAMLLLDLVAEGTLSLDDSTGEVLGWLGA